jgi:hypothetical protein
MSSRRPVSPIAREWLRLIELRDQPETRAEARAAWQTLWRDHVEGDRLAEMDVHDATLICSLGYSLAMLDGDPLAGLRRIERWFEHPQARTAEYPDWPSMLDYAARCHLALGDEAEAIALYRQLMAEAPRLERRVRRAMVRNALLDRCRGEPRDNLVSTRLAQFARELVTTYRIRPMVARSIGPGRTTFGMLAAALERTIRKRQNRRSDRRIRRRFLPFRAWQLRQERTG